MSDKVSATLVLEKGDDLGKTFHLGEGRVLLGRGPREGYKISFDNSFVSRTHAEISYERDSFWLRDLDSTNGTWVNGKRLDNMEDHQLCNDDIIELGKGAIVLRFSQTEKTAKIAEDQLKVIATTPISIDERARDTWVDGVKLDPPLAFRDFELLLILYRNLEKACSKDELAKAWDEEFVTDEQIEQSIRRIRRRIEPDPSNPSRVITIRGYGYKLTIPTQGHNPG